MTTDTKCHQNLLCCGWNGANWTYGPSPDNSHYSLSERICIVIKHEGSILCEHMHKVVQRLVWVTHKGMKLPEVTIVERVVSV